MPTRSWFNTSERTFDDSFVVDCAASYQMCMDWLAERCFDSWGDDQNCSQTIKDISECVERFPDVSFLLDSPTFQEENWCMYISGPWSFFPNATFPEEYLSNVYLPCENSVYWIRHWILGVARNSTSISNVSYSTSEANSTPTATQTNWTTPPIGLCFSETRRASFCNSTACSQKGTVNDDASSNSLWAGNPNETMPTRSWFNTSERTFDDSFVVDCAASYQMCMDWLAERCFDSWGDDQNCSQTIKDISECVERFPDVSFLLDSPTFQEENWCMYISGPWSFFPNATFPEEYLSNGYPPCENSVYWIRYWILGEARNSTSISNVSYSSGEANSTPSFPSTSSRSTTTAETWITTQDCATEPLEDNIALPAEYTSHNCTIPSMSVSDVCQVTCTNASSVVGFFNCSAHGFMVGRSYCVDLHSYSENVSVYEVQKVTALLSLTISTSEDTGAVASAFKVCIAEVLSIEPAAVSIMLQILNGSKVTETFSLRRLVGEKTSLVFVRYEAIVSSSLDPLSDKQIEAYKDVAGNFAVSTSAEHTALQTLLSGLGVVLSGEVTAVAPVEVISNTAVLTSSGAAVDMAYLYHETGSSVPTETGGWLFGLLVCLAVCGACLCGCGCGLRCRQHLLYQRSAT